MVYCKLAKLSVSCYKKEVVLVCKGKTLLVLRPWLETVLDRVDMFPGGGALNWSPFVWKYSYNGHRQRLSIDTLPRKPAIGNWLSSALFSLRLQRIVKLFMNHFRL